CRYDTSACVASCGNNTIEAGEQCDGNGHLNGATCQTLGYATGTLHCSGTCHYDVSLCTSDCGNDIAETGEQCDGTDKNGATCLPGGFDGGPLGCHASGPSKCTFDPGACTMTTTCGNNNAEAGEQCDGSDKNGATCMTLGYVGGTLGCTSCHFDT